MSFLIEIVVSYIMGITFAQFDSFLVPLLLVLVAGICQFSPSWFRLRAYTMLCLVSAFSCLIALQDCSLPHTTERQEKTATYRHLITRIERLNITDESKAVCKGILLGETHTLTRQQKQSIREAGMSHIMAVSGLHIGILYLVMFWLMYPLRIIGMPRLHRIITIVIIWLYVYVIGFPVSSVRAALMFTLVIVSWVLRRNSDSLHIISSAALLMLLFDTQQLWDIGFQLSFIAALSIILMRPIWTKANRVGQMFIVTLTAQVFTMPIVLYYFHLAPLFGWVQGILVIPLLPLLVYALMLQIAFPFIPFMSCLIDWIVRWIFLVADNVSALESWSLGGRLLWYPSLSETCVMLLLLFLGYILLVRR